MLSIGGRAGLESLAEDEALAGLGAGRGKREGLEGDEGEGPQEQRLDGIGKGQVTERRPLPTAQALERQKVWVRGDWGQEG